jgi:hypothetical protein
LGSDTGPKDLFNQGVCKVIHGSLSLLRERRKKQISAS